METLSRIASSEVRHPSRRPWSWVQWEGVKDRGAARVTWNERSGWERRPEMRLARMAVMKQGFKREGPTSRVPVETKREETDHR